MYKTLLSVKQQKNRHPLTFGYGFYNQTAAQTRDYLLCESCEQRFQQNGERWVLANCYRAGKIFPLREILEQTPPYYADKDILIYAASRIPEIDTRSLEYFAMSMFWRAGAHSWRFGERRISINLGPYTESIRTFLLDQTPFPDHMTLAVMVGIEDLMIEWALNPISHNEDGFHSHMFTIPGITFSLTVGGRIPNEFLDVNFAPFSERFIVVYPAAERRQLAELSKAFQNGVRARQKR